MTIGRVDATHRRIPRDVVTYFQHEFPVRIIVGGKSDLHVALGLYTMLVAQHPEREESTRALQTF